MPRKFVVAWINFFDNVLSQEYVIANSVEEALKDSDQDIFTFDAELEKMNLEDLKQFAFDCDGMVSVLEL